jgi:hypothetical protein
VKGNGLLGVVGWRPVRSGEIDWGAGVRTAKAKIQPGGYFGRFDDPDDIDPVVSLFALENN